MSKKHKTDHRLEAGATPPAASDTAPDAPDAPDTPDTAPPTLAAALPSEPAPEAGTPILAGDPEAAGPGSDSIDEDARSPEATPALPPAAVVSGSGPVVMGPVKGPPLPERPVGLFTTVADIDLELLRLGDPWERFKAGPVAAREKAVADRARITRELEEAESKAWDEERRQREILQVDLERVRLLKLRRAEIAK